MELFLFWLVALSAAMGVILIGLVIAVLIGDHNYRQWLKSIGRDPDA